jgi:hypothetical protein
MDCSWRSVERIERCDDGHQIPTDTPLKTVTVFGPFTTNTFSYYNASGFVEIQEILDAFIAAHTSL